MAVRDVSNREETLACENDSHIIRLRERGVKQGEGRNSTLGGRHRIVHNQLLTLGQLAYTLCDGCWRVRRSGYGNVLNAVMPPKITHNSYLICRIYINSSTANYFFPGQRNSALNKIRRKYHRKRQCLDVTASDVTQTLLQEKLSARDVAC
jgi:hypothetical protein